MPTPKKLEFGPNFETLFFLLSSVLPHNSFDLSKAYGAIPRDQTKSSTSPQSPCTCADAADVRSIYDTPTAFESVILGERYIMENVVTVGCMVPGFANASFTPYLPLDGVDSTKNGGTITV